MTDSSDPNYFRGQQVPESVRAKLIQAQLAQQLAAQQERPYTSQSVVALKALSGLMGSIQERQAIEGEQQAQAAHRQLLAQLLTQSASPGAVGAAAPTFGAGAASSAGTSPGLGIPTSAAASRAGNPAGYDPKATEALIRARAPAYGIDPDTAVAIARSEGLNSYHGDGGSSFGPFQLHYGGVAKGGNAVGGLGDSFTKQTGLDARDPSTVPQQIDFSLSQAAKGGWEPWHGRKTPGVNIGVWDGIGQAPKTAAGQLAAVPGSDAVPKAGAGNTDPGLVAAAPAATATLAGGQGTDALGTPSPFGAPPSPMVSPTGADPKALAAALRASVPSATSPGSDTVQPPVVPDPQGSLTAPSPFGAGPSPMAAPSPSSNTQALAAALREQAAQRAPTPPVAATAPQDPTGGLSPNGLQMAALGAGNPSTLAGMAQAAPPISAAPLSTDGAVGFDNLNTTKNPDGTPAVTQSSLGAPGFTGVPDDGSAAAAINGSLPGPQAYVGGPMGLGTGPTDPSAPSPSMLAQALRQSAGTPTPAPMSPPAQAPMVTPPPATPPAQVATLPSADDPLGGLMGSPDGAKPSTSDITTAAMAKAGYDTSALTGAMPPQGSVGGLGPAASARAAAAAPMMADPNVPAPDLSGLGAPTTPPPPGAAMPIMARASSNPPAVLAQALRASSPAGPSMRPAGDTTDTTLPDTGPMPPPGAQTIANAAAPAPGAANAGPAPMPPGLLAQALRSSQPQPLGLAGDGGADPSSARSFLTSQAPGQGGGASPSLLAQVLRGNSPTTASATAPAPSSSPANPGPLDGLGRLFNFGGSSSGGNPLAGLPVIGDLFGGGQGQQAQPQASYGSGQGQQGVPFTPGGQGAQPGQPGTPAGNGQATGGLSQQQMAALVLNDPRSTPDQLKMAMSILRPDPVKVVQGETLVGRRPDGTYGSLYAAPNKPDWQDLGNGMMVDKNDPNGRAMPIPGGRAPVKLAPGDQLVGPNGPLAAVPVTPDYRPVPGTGTALNSRDGSSIALPGGAGSSVHSIKVNGIDVPVMVTPNPNGGPPQVQMLTPGAAAGPGGTGQPAGAGAPISFNGTPQGAAPQGGPLDAIASLVKQAGQMKADESAQVKEADTQVAEQAKIAQAGRDARVKLAQLDQLEQLSGKFGNNFGTKINAKLNEWGLPTQSGTDQDAFRGLVGALAVGERPAGSGSLRVAEMDAFKSNLGDSSMNQAGRIAAINRYRTVLQRDAQIGDLAADTTLSPGERATRIQTLSQQPYTSVGGTDGSGTVVPQGGAPTASAAPPQATPTPSDALAQAQAAIARGAPRAAVIQRLQAAGINPAGL